MKISQKARHAILLGTLCFVSYLAVYIARNILGVLTASMEADGFTKEYIGNMSSLYLTFYAVGQLINGAIGNRIKAKYMMSVGLFLAGISNVMFPILSGVNWPNADLSPIVAMVTYATTGFFLSMIYGPMTKVVAESTELKYATRCSLGYTFSSFFGSPVAGWLAMALSWQATFAVSSAALIGMAIICFVCFILFERKGIVKYPQRKKKGSDDGEGVEYTGIKGLFKHQIVKFAVISILTGIIRTSVVFWLTSYFFEYLGYTEPVSEFLFSAATLVMSFTAFIAIFAYERMGRNMHMAVLMFFSIAMTCFAALYFIKIPFINIILIVLGIMASNSAASVLWSVYCPSLRDTGLVSGATGFLDFLSYMAAAIANIIFPGAVKNIGWRNLILVWCGIMVIGVLISLPYGKIFGKGKKKEACDG